MEKVCAHCGQPGEALRRCTGCWNIRYCSRDCQKRHWPRHKVTCVKSPPASAARQEKKREKDEPKGEKQKPIAGQKTPSATREAEDAKDGSAQSASEGASPVIFVCKTCKTKSSTPVKCDRCQDVTYCSRDCRRADWLTHMVTCIPVSPAAESPEKTEHTPAEDEDGENKSKPKDHLPEASGEHRPDLAEGEDEDVKTCQKCKTKKKDMKRCGRCYNVTYCSRDCQTADWTSHKVTCEAIEVLTTEGYRETERREEAARREATNHLVNLLRQSHLFTGASTQHLTWQEAKSRASRLFPFHRVVDDFSLLDSDFMGLPFRMFAPWMDVGMGAGVVAVGRLTTPYFHPFRPARGVEDINGMSVYVIFYTGDSPWPFFQFSQLREGNFICIQGAFLHLFADGSVGFRVDDVTDIRILGSTP